MNCGRILKNKYTKQNQAKILKLDKNIVSTYKYIILFFLRL